MYFQEVGQGPTGTAFTHGKEILCNATASLSVKKKVLKFVTCGFRSCEKACLGKVEGAWLCARAAFVYALILNRKLASSQNSTSFTQLNRRVCVRVYEYSSFLTPSHFVVYFSLARGDAQAKSKLPLLTT